MIDPTKDPLGQAFLDYIHTGKEESIKVDTNHTEDEEITASYFFRTFDDMPLMEQKALELTTGKTLDAGAGAGVHSLYLQKKGVEVEAIDVSNLSCEAMSLRGVRNVRCESIYDQKSTYDTILMLMNGMGMVQTLSGLGEFLKFVKKLLNPGGQLLIDSSDVIYLFEEEDGSFLIDLNDRYYGEMTYEISYKNIQGDPFPWLYVGYDLLEEYATKSGFNCELVVEGEHYDYLARLTC